MLVSTVLRTEDGADIPAFLLIRFAHTPATTKRENGTVKTNTVRSCRCELALVTPAKLSDRSVEFTSKITNKAFMTPLSYGKSTCLLYRGDLYCRAYGRVITLERALRSMMYRDLEPDEFLNITKLEKDKALTIDGQVCPFKFTDKTFRDCMATLRKAHPHGMQAADKMRNGK